MSPQKNTKMIEMVHQSTQQKQILTQLTKKINQGKFWLRKSTCLLSQKKKLTQSTKQRNHKHPNKQLIPTKTIKLTQLTQYVNKFLVQ